jgi:MFS family permease
MAQTILPGSSKDQESGLKNAGRSVSTRGTTTFLAVLCFMYLVLYIDRVNIATLAPRMMADLSLNNTQFGLAVSAFAFPYALFQLVGGWTSDRIGARQTLVACGVIICIATITTGMVAGLVSLVLARLLLGIGEGAAFPAASRALLERVSSSRWGFAQGITHGSARLGNAVAPIVVVGLLAHYSWRGSFVVLGMASIVWVALWPVVYRSPVSPSPKEVSKSTEKLRQTHASPVPWLRLAKRMAPVTAVDFCYGWTLWVFLTWLPSFFLKSFHLDLKSSAIFSSGVLFGGVLGDATGGFVSDFFLRRTGSLQVARRNVIACGMLGAFFFLLPVVLVHNLNTVAICLSAACFFSELVVGPIWAVPMDIAPRYAGTASGMMNFGFGVAGIISPVIFGGMLDLTGSWTIPFCVSISLLLLGAMLSFFMRPDIPFEDSRTHLGLQ